MSRPATNQGETRPGHYLDYFHGALYLSPDGARIFDDGWLWQPAGIPVAWELAAWLDGNPWESEDGPTKVDFCWLQDWDRAFTWIGSHHVAIEDTGDDETRHARAFSTSLRPPPPAPAAPPGRRNRRSAGS